MTEHIETYPSAHPVVRYRVGAHLRSILTTEIVAGAEKSTASSGRRRGGRGTRVTLITR